MSAADQLSRDASSERAGSDSHVDKDGEHAKPKASASSARNGATLHAAFKDGNNIEAYNYLVDRLRREYKPIGTIQKLLVDRVAIGAVRLQQADALGRELFPWTSTKHRVSLPISSEIRQRVYLAALAPNMGKERPITREMVQAAVLKTPSIGELLGERSSDPARLTPPNLNALLLFQRYERAAAADFFAALKELAREQEARRRQMAEARSLRLGQRSKAKANSRDVAGRKPARK